MSDLRFVDGGLSKAKVSFIPLLEKVTTMTERDVGAEVKRSKLAVASVLERERSINSYRIMGRPAYLTLLVRPEIMCVRRNGFKMASVVAGLHKSPVAPLCEQQVPQEAIYPDLGRLRVEPTLTVSQCVSRKECFAS